MHTILVIDDNQAYRADLLEILQYEDYATLEAENGLVGLQMIRQHSPDLILSDVDMPVMSGMDLLRAVKADPNYARIPFVVATARNDSRTQRTAQDLGAQTYLTKPVDISLFLATIVKLLQRIPSVNPGLHLNGDPHTAPLP
jgi:CheY-like chemotaxis protein